MSKVYYNKEVKEKNKYSFCLLFNLWFGSSINKSNYLTQNASQETSLKLTLSFQLIILLLKAYPHLCKTIKKTISRYGLTLIRRHSAPKVEGSNLHPIVLFKDTVKITIVRVLHRSIEFLSVLLTF